MINLKLSKMIESEINLQKQKKYQIQSIFEIKLKYKKNRF